MEKLPFKFSAEEKPSRGENESDWNFLVGFLDFALRRKLFEMEIPEMAKLVNQVKGKTFDESQHLQLYSKTTYMEFHKVFVELLRFFSHELDALKKHLNTWDPSHLNSALKRALFIGFGLQRLARGSALQMHLRNIEGDLTDFHRDDCDEDPDERDEAFEEIHHSAWTRAAKRPARWKFYRDWLRTMLVHFDAIEVLATHASGQYFPYDYIKVRVFVPRRRQNDSNLLKWEKLLESPALFPGGNGPNNNDISEFLKKKFNPAGLDWAINVRKKWNSANASVDSELVKMEMERWKGSKLNGWEDAVDQLNTALADQLPGLFTSTIDSLISAGRLLINFSNERTFTGSLHCEASLASLLQDRLVEDITIDGVDQWVMLFQTCFCHQIFISCNRVLTESLECRSFAARCVIISSNS